MKLRVISDVHVELYPSYQELIQDLEEYISYNDSDEILILAGDVGIATDGNKINSDYFKILRYFKSRWDTIILVPGNHEYYNSQVSIEEVDKILSKTCRNLGIHFLNCKSINLFGYTFIGCCLWSRINKEAYSYVNSSIQRLLPREKYLDTHYKHVDYLIDELNSNKNTIVITHYVPTPKLIDKKYLTDNYKITSSGYYTDLTELIKTFSKNINYWICGHSHTSRYAVINSTFCFLNPFGNPTQDPTMFRGILPL